jgi:hypothetical protein
VPTSVAVATAILVAAVLQIAEAEEALGLAGQHVMQRCRKPRE